MIRIVSNTKENFECHLHLFSLDSQPYIFQITGPNITQAILERKATRKKRKTEIEHLNGPNCGCDANNKFNSI